VQSDLIGEIENTPDLQDVHLIQTIINANRSSDGWQKLLNQLLDHFNLKNINLYLADPRNMSLKFQDWAGEIPTQEYTEEYINIMFPFDKVHRTLLASEVGTWVTGNFEPYQSMLLATPNFKEWMDKYDHPYTTGVVLYRNNPLVCCMLFQRGEAQGPFTREEENRLKKITPFLVAAIDIRVKLANLESNTYIFSALINMFSLPVAIVNEFSEVIITNRKMNDFLSSQNHIKISGDKRFKFKDEVSDKKLSYSLVQSVSASRPNPMAYDNETIFFTDNSKKGSFFIGTCELENINKEGESSYKGALVYITNPSILNSIDEEYFITLFGLTPSEAKVCSLFMEHKSPKQIALEEDKSVNTVREQLKNVYVKTGAKNQLELMSLLHSIPRQERPVKEFP
jgi:DNA-binding CsgD family transcriptional regulator